MAKATRETTSARPVKPAKAHGRSLSDFLPLLPTEEKLREACRTGDWANFGTARPDAKTRNNEIRSGVLRFFILGGDEMAPVHERGVRVTGAWIDDDIDLDGCNSEVPFFIHWCRVRGVLSAYYARLVSLSLRGSVIDGEFLSKLRKNQGLPYNGPAGRRISLYCDGISTRGDVNLHGAHFVGEVRLPKARICGNLDLSKACIIGTDGDAEVTDSTCLHAQSTLIKGSLILKEIQRAQGRIDLRSCRTGALNDDARSWEQFDGYVLDHFRYERLVGIEHTKPARRIYWLQRQVYDPMRPDLRPQPWEHLAKVLRDMGHDEEARKIAIAKQARQRKAWRITDIRRPLHWLYGLLAGYGYRPFWTVCWMAGTWLLFGTAFAIGGNFGWFGPSSPLIHKNPDIVENCAKDSGNPQFNWTTCTHVPPAYTTFQPYSYSLDLILPLVDLQQEKDWAPMVVQADGLTPLEGGIWLRRLVWLEILFGWGMSLLLVAVIGNLVKKD
jgi:hypothetical protein